MPPLPDGFNPFEARKPPDFQATRIEAIRAAFFECYNRVIRNTNPGSISGRYQALAKTALEESCMWATKSVAFEEDTRPPPHVSGDQKEER